MDPPPPLPQSEIPDLGAPVLPSCRAATLGCQSGWGRLLSVTNAIEAGTCHRGTVAGRRLGALEGGAPPPPPAEWVGSRPLLGVRPSGEGGRGGGVCRCWVGGLQAEKKFVYQKSTSKFGPRLINFIFFPRKSFLLWVGGWVGGAGLSGSEAAAKCPPQSASKGLVAFH